MNVFLWNGPAFLFAYIVFGYLVVRITRALIEHMESATTEPALALASDPYRIAFLRGGAGEAFMLATAVLLDRGQLTATRRIIKTVDVDAIDSSRNGFERDVLHHFTVGGLASNSDTVAGHLPSALACKEFLEQRKLLAGTAVTGRRQVVIFPAMLLLIGVAMYKTGIAWSHGHANVLFLCLACLGYVLHVRSLGDKRITIAGLALLSSLEILFRRLKSRAKRLVAGDGSNDMALLAAIFGISALSVEVYPFLAELGVLAIRKDSGDSGDSSGGGDSSSGSSCGSSCGGGGGCGGCGS
jgi:uncharacterized protein (TIGR04222 family)